MLVATKSKKGKQQTRRGKSSQQLRLDAVKCPGDRAKDIGNTSVGLLSEHREGENGDITLHYSAIWSLVLEWTIGGSVGRLSRERKILWQLVVVAYHPTKLGSDKPRLGMMPSCQVAEVFRGGHVHTERGCLGEPV